MLRRTEKTGKTVEEAIAAGLAELNIDQSQAEIEVVEEGTKGFLGLGGKEFKVIITKKLSLDSVAKEFIDSIIKPMGLNAEYKITQGIDKLKITIEGDDMGILIGYRGETLDALQYLTSLIVNKHSEEFIKVSVDTENYREKREETLIRLARKLAGQVIKTRQSITLEPMNPNERRIIHSSLQDGRDIYTYSIGEEPNRKIVIALKDHRDIDNDD